ncbi:hypothetical protein BGZ98_000316 [Dissophora globulifera]|nr:hypothetical protein BGZ98_000316 [Dissophora globulifera]
MKLFPRAIFLDSGGVINDNDRRAPQWIYHLQEFMPLTQLGGPGHLWGRANAILTNRLFTEDPAGGVRDWDRLLQEAKDFDDFDRQYLLYWIHNSVKLVNQFLKEEHEQGSEVLQQKGQGEEHSPTWVQIVLPESEEEQIRIARDAHMYCTALVQADYPGAVEAIIDLKFKQGFEMYTCSGESATELELTFRTLGISTVSASETIVEELPHHPSSPSSLQEEMVEVTSRRLQPVFTKLYGPDLIRCQKSSSRFYELIFKDSRVNPNEAVIVDDKEYILGWAKVHGARTVMISDKNRGGKELLVEVEEKDEQGKVVAVKKVPAVDHQIGSLAELPALVASWRKEEMKEV